MQEMVVGAVSGNTGGRRRSDGAGARNRTETGGEGGNANTSFIRNGTVWLYGIGDSGDCGGDAESCGKVTINNNICVYAYGGARTVEQVKIEIMILVQEQVDIQQLELVGGRSWAAVGGDHCYPAGRIC